METPPSPKYRVADLQKGDRVAGGVFLVEQANFKQTRNKKYFIQMSLRDRSGSIRAVRWEATKELYDSFGPDDFIEVDARVEEFQGLPQLIVDRLARTDPSTIDYEQFLPVSERDPDEMRQELLARIEEVARPELRQLLLDVVRSPDVGPGLQRCPAGKTLHHAYVGGLLEHICSVLGLARGVAECYPQLDRDLLYAAAVLHDIGKVRELSWHGSFRYTDEGQLLGHVGLGILLVREHAAGIAGFPEDVLLEVLHIIASHHGVPEYGALKLPMTPEAIAFHYLDNLDAKLSSLASIERELPSGPEEPSFAGRWSEYKPHLSRKIYFPPKPDETDDAS